MNIRLAPTARLSRKARLAAYEQARARVNRTGLHSPYAAAFALIVSFAAGLAFAAAFLL